MVDDEYGKEPSNAEIAAMVAFLAFSIDRYVKNRARRTIVENAQFDPAKPKCRWVSEPGACDFCQQRGSFLYDPKETPSGSHGGCKCHPNVVFASAKGRISALWSRIEESRVRRFVRSDKQPKTIAHAKYLQHHKDSKAYANLAKQKREKGKYPPSYLTISEEQCEELIRKYAGTGELTYNKGSRHSKDRHITETITENDMVIGCVINDQTGKEVATTVFKIHYRNDGAHIVPDYPSKKRDSRKGRRS